MKIRQILCAVLMLALPSYLFSQGLTFEEQIYDFGHVGIDFKIQHTYIFENRTDIPIAIQDIAVSCECTTVNSVDTLVQPGDSAFFNLTFDTKDYYGPINKSFKVMTDHPLLPELEYFYLSIVGQWFNGLKPSPISLFFLPSKKAQKITIPNIGFESLSIVSVSPPNNYITVQTITESAEKGKFVEIEISTHDYLGEGTYQTTVTIGLKAEGNEVTFLSIPVKIVRY